VQGVEAIVLWIPFGIYPDLANLLNEVPTDVAVIDTSNYYPFRDDAIAEVDGGKPGERSYSESFFLADVGRVNPTPIILLAESRFLTAGGGWRTWSGWRS
jgi:hypothetical protein